MSAHAYLSPSAAHRWMQCPAAPRLEALLPDTGSRYAEEGATAHELAALCLTLGLDASSLPAGGDWARFDAGMREAVQSYLDLVRAEPGHRYVEYRVDFSRWVPDGFGTADCLVFHEGVGAVIDLKYGQGVRVDARENPQLMLYALGADHSLGFIHDVDLWRLIICQPRLDHVSVWEIRRKDLVAWAEASVKPAAARALSSDAEPAPGEKQCRFCRAKAVCRARAEANLRLAREDFAQPLPPPAMLSLDEIARILPQLDALVAWAGDVRDHATARAMAGETVPGYKLVAGRSVRRWADSAAAALEALLGEAAWEKKLLGISAAEKLLGRSHPIFAEHTVKPEGAPTLAPLSDPRPAMTAAGVDFRETSETV